MDTNIGGNGRDHNKSRLPKNETSIRSTHDSKRYEYVDEDMADTLKDHGKTLELAISILLLWLEYFPRATNIHMDHETTMQMITQLTQDKE